MPYVNGVKVSVAEYHRMQGFDPSFQYSDAVKRATGTDEQPEPSAVPEEAKPKRRRGTKKNEAEDALRAITGLDISLGDEENEDDNSE